MATRADYYTLIKGELKFLGSTSNAYDGDYLEAKTLNQFVDRVNEELKGNNSIQEKWYWPWTNSKLTDEVFIFKNTPKLFNKSAGKVLMKIHSDGKYDTGLAHFVEYKGMLGDVDTTGMEIDVIQLPEMFRK